MAITVQWQQATKYPAKYDRSAINAMMYQSGDVEVRDGCLTKGGLTPTHTTGMTIKVSAGQAVVSGYLVTVDIAETVTLDVGGAQKRTDLVVLRVYDEAEADSQSKGVVEVVKGDPGGAVPNTPARSLVLAKVAVTATASTIDAGDLTDERVWTTGRGGVLYLPGALQSDPPDGIEDGQVVYDPNENALGVRNGAHWDWLTPGGNGGVTDVAHGGTGVDAIPTSKFMRGSGGGGGNLVFRTFQETWDDIANQGTVILDGAHGGTGISNVPQAEYLRGSGGTADVWVTRTPAQVWDDVANKGSTPVNEAHGGTGVTAIPASKFLRGSGGGGGSAVFRSYTETWDDIVNQGTKPLDPQHGGTGASGAPAKSFPRGSDTGSGNLAWRSYQQVMSDLYGNPAPLGDGQNLNTSGLLGVYFVTSANAASGSNFPTNSGGMLEAFSQGSLGLVQRYTVYDGSAIYARTFYDFGSVWSPWQLIGGDTGWINCSMKSGVTGQIQARLLNGVVYFKGSCSYTHVNPGAAGASKTLFSLPTSIPNPPNQMSMFNSGTNDGGDIRTVTVYLTADGNCQSFATASAGLNVKSGTDSGYLNPYPTS